MAIDWTNIYNTYKGRWVALEEDEITVRGSGKTAKQALEQANRNGLERPILFRVPTKIIPYVGSALV